MCGIAFECVLVFVDKTYPVVPRIGDDKVALQCDSEPALVSVANIVAASSLVQLLARVALRTYHASNGTVERFSTGRSWHNIEP